jgi:hypothetical protein
MGVSPSKIIIAASAATQHPAPFGVLCWALRVTVGLFPWVRIAGSFAFVILIDFTFQTSGYGGENWEKV